jgi:hypothetical protein
MRFARTYVITYRMELLGLVAFVGGCGLAALTRIGALFVVFGFVTGAVGIIASNASAYRALRSSGHARYYAWTRCGPESVPSPKRYKDYLALLHADR